MVSYDECPHCGAQVRRGRLACPECGSDARTGWASQEDIDYQSVEIPDVFDERALRPQRASRVWLVAVVLALLAAFVFAFVL